MHDAAVSDEPAVGLLGRIDRALVRLRLDSQGEFIAILNAIETQIESGNPAIPTVAHLGDALLTLADAPGVDINKHRLPSNCTGCSIAFSFGRPLDSTLLNNYAGCASSQPPHSTSSDGAPGGPDLTMMRLGTVESANAAARDTTSGTSVVAPTTS